MHGGLWSEALLSALQLCDNDDNDLDDDDLDSDDLDDGDNHDDNNDDEARGHGQL